MGDARTGNREINYVTDPVGVLFRRLTEYFDAQQISAAFITPQMFRLYKGSRGMKRALVGSERLSGVYSEDFEICNAYGLSETLGGVCSFLVDRKYDNTPIGKPLEGVEIRLLDEDGNAVPKGAEGEICLLGHFADGYLNMPEATAAAFIRQPGGTVLLHTGDIGVLDENSNLVYLNRKDWMVKINGQRVETQEIENLLKKIDGVTNAAVQAFDDRMGQKYLAAFYSLRLGLDENELRKTDALAKAKAVYEGIFGGVSLNSLPAAEKAADKESPGKAATAEYALPAVAPENAAAFCKANQITENALFTAAFGLLLARMDGSDEALFASIYNGRTRLETMRIMGMLVKTYPIYVSCDRGCEHEGFPARRTETDSGPDRK